MELHGRNLIGGSASGEWTYTFQAYNPSLGMDLDPLFYEATPAEVERTMRFSGEAIHEYRQQSPDARANFLKRAADEIMNLGDALIERCSAETGLGVDRLVGERGWTPGSTARFRIGSRFPSRMYDCC